MWGILTAQISNLFYDGWQLWCCIPFYSARCRVLVCYPFLVPFAFLRLYMWSMRNFADVIVRVCCMAYVPLHDRGTHTQMCYYYASHICGHINEYLTSFIMVTYWEILSWHLSRGNFLFWNFQPFLRKNYIWININTVEKNKLVFYKRSLSILKDIEIQIQMMWHAKKSKDNPCHNKRDWYSKREYDQRYERDPWTIKNYI